MRSRPAPDKSDPAASLPRPGPSAPFHGSLPRARADWDPHFRFPESELRRSHRWAPASPSVQGSHRRRGSSRGHPNSWSQQGVDTIRQDADPRRCQIRWPPTGQALDRIPGGRYLNGRRGSLLRPRQTPPGFGPPATRFHPARKPRVVLFSRGSWRAVVDPAEARIPAPREGLSEWDGLVRGGGPNPHTPSIRRAYRQQATALASIFGPGDTWESDLETLRVNLQALRTQNSCQTRCRAMSVGSQPVYCSPETLPRVNSQCQSLLTL